MTPSTMFRENPELDMGRYQIPGYSGHFPGQNAYPNISKGKATQSLLQDGGYFDHDLPHSILEPNQEDPVVERLLEADALNRREHFDLSEHDQGGRPVYRHQMLPGYTGHNPCVVDKIGHRFASQSLEGTLEFERIKKGIPRYTFKYPARYNQLAPIGGRDHKETDLIDRDLAPIDATVPEFVPRYMSHRQKQIVAAHGIGLLEKTHSEFTKATEKQGSHGNRVFKPSGPPIYREVNLRNGTGGDYHPESLGGKLHYRPKILPPPRHPLRVPISVEIQQPAPMDIVVEMPSWQPDLALRLASYCYGHNMSGCAGFIPHYPRVLGSSVNRAVMEGFPYPIPTYPYYVN